MRRKRRREGEEGNNEDVYKEKQREGRGGEEAKVEGKKIRELMQR